MFIVLLYLFRTTMCPSSGENTVPMRHLVFVTIWMTGMQGGPSFGRALPSVCVCVSICVCVRICVCVSICVWSRNLNYGRPMSQSSCCATEKEANRMFGRKVFLYLSQHCHVIGVFNIHSDFICKCSSRRFALLRCCALYKLGTSRRVSEFWVGLFNICWRTVKCLNRLHLQKLVVTLQKLVVTLVVEKVPYPYWSRSSIDAFTTAWHWMLSWARRIHSTSFHPICLRYFPALSCQLRVRCPSSHIPEISSIPLSTYNNVQDR
jgi:hypothetical protein